MAKITIYVPESKEAEIREWEKKLNFSEIFRDAFDQAVARCKATANISDAQIKSTVERLKAEQGEDFEAGRLKGLEDGVEWARESASLKDLRRISEDVPDANELVTVLIESWCDEDYFQDVRHGEGIADKYDYGSFIQGYAHGFSDGAESVWIKVADKLD